MSPFSVIVVCGIDQGTFDEVLVYRHRLQSAPLRREVWVAGEEQTVYLVTRRSANEEGADIDA